MSGTTSLISNGWAALGPLRARRQRIDQRVGSRTREQLPGALAPHAVRKPALTQLDRLSAAGAGSSRRTSETR